MRDLLRLMAVIMLLGSSIGPAFGATISFDKSIDVPDKEFTVKYPDDETRTFTFTIDKIGSYKFGDSVGISVNGGVNRMRLVSWNVDKISSWSESVESSGNSVTTNIPSNKFDPSCQDVCENLQMGPGIYALTVQDLVNGPPYNYITAKPFIISEYDLRVTPEVTQVEPGSSIAVTVTIKKSGNLIDVNNNVKVELVQDSTGTHFGETAARVSTGTYKANIPIPSTATGTHLLYAAITTNEMLYQDYPEIMGAESGGSVQITRAASPQTASLPTSGGGGGAPSGEDPLNIEVREKYELEILKDTVTSYRFKNSTNPIYLISITGNTNFGLITTSIEVLRDTSSLLQTPAPGLVYKNMNIWVGTKGFPVPKNIKTAVINFKVENSWISSNGLSSDVKLVKWDGSQWIQLETQELGTRGEFTLFESKTDSFSPFAIVIRSPEVTPVATQTQKPVLAQTPSEVVTETPLKTTHVEKTTNLPVTVVILLFMMAVTINKARNKK